MASRINTVGNRVAVLAATLTLFAAGCGSGSGSVTGEVKYNGASLPSGTITFLGQSGDRQVASSDITDGKYTIPRLQPGPAAVTVVTIAPSRGGAPPSGKTIDAPTSAAPRAYVPIPTRYASPEQSGLTYEVKSGAQVKDFDLSR